MVESVNQCMARVGASTPPERPGSPRAGPFAGPERRESLLAAEMERARDLLEGIGIAHFRIRARSEGEVEAPFAGSLIRGALGASLRGAACAEQGRPCPGCGLEDRCLFPALFGGRGAGARPFALVPPERIGEGPFSFDLKVFGQPEGSIPALLRAVLEMGRSGIGRDRTRVPVERIESLGPFGREASALFEEKGGLDLGGIRSFPAARIFDGDPSARGAGGPLARIALRLRTPLRSKRDGRIAAGLDPEGLLHAALGRLIEVGAALGQDWPRRWPAALEASRSMVVLESDLRRLDLRRFSRRQGRPLRLGGVAGRIALGGVPREVLGLLRTAAFLHLGKNATFGLGAIEIEEVL